MNYKTPGVYIEEISLFPPSVAQVETAIPAFIGYTETTLDEDGNTVSTFPFVQRITSLKEYEEQFGKAQAQSMTVNVEGDSPATVASYSPSNYKMYYSLQMYYANGGGPCYIISVGNYISAGLISAADLQAGLDALKKKDEPTLILFPDGVGMSLNTNYYDLLKAALLQCSELGDRFTLCDIFDDSDVANFRNAIGVNHLKYGAAYYPHLKTNLNPYYEESTIVFNAPASPGAPAEDNTNGSLDTQSWGDIQEAIDLHNTHTATLRAETTVAALDAIVTAGDADIGAEPDATAPALAISMAQAAVDAATTTLNAINTASLDNATATANLAAAQALLDAALLSTDQVTAAAAVSTVTSVMTDITTAIDAAETSTLALLNTALTTNLGGAAIADITAVYNDNFIAELKTLLAKEYLTMPPTSSVAGVYAAVDASRGVWKAPANVSLSFVTAPTTKVTNAEQDGLNIDTTGKSVNAIRTFAGKGTLIWGARTLAGNDNEWRYVPVRRFFNMVEESVKKATEPFVFEPNDANTWVKVKAMIENFLTLQWRAGALAGATPDDAFFVKVGLGETMTSLDILEGRMIVEIGMAAVRPAEFIILKFSHKMQES